MTKVVINRCYGGFGLSHKAVLRYLELKGYTPYWEVDKITLKVFGANYDPNCNDGHGIVHYGTHPDFMKGDCPGYFNHHNIPRDDPALLRVISEFGTEANSWSSNLKVVEIPDGVEWQVEEYDGFEHVTEQHQTWS